MHGEDVACFLKVEVCTVALFDFADELFHATLPYEKHVFPTPSLEILELTFAENVVVVCNENEDTRVQPILFIGKMLHNLFAGGSGNSLTNDDEEDVCVTPGDVKIILFFPAIFGVKSDMAFAISDGTKVRGTGLFANVAEVL